MPLPIEYLLKDRYRILARLGQGGMGAVYKAYDVVLDRECAVKERIPDPLAEQGALDEAHKQFLGEAQVLAKLAHPNLPRVTDYFSVAGNDYLVMDFVEGANLAELLEMSERSTLPEEDVLDWTAQLLNALEYCHSRNVIHRDVKPQNIIVTPDGWAMLVDFGLMKLHDPIKPTTAAIIRGMGTPEYAPPEQYDSLHGSYTDVRSDIYSLGATLFHLITGQASPTAIRRLADHTSLSTPRSLNPQISRTVERVILKAMAMSPKQRFQKIAEMRQALFPCQRKITLPRLPTLKQVPRLVWQILVELSLIHISEPTRPY